LILFQCLGHEDVSEPPAEIRVGPGVRCVHTKLTDQELDTHLDHLERIH